jgi:hypothetical protein
LVVSVLQMENQFSAKSIRMNEWTNQ